MASINKVILIGNLGRDPEVRYTPNGSAICNVSVATTRNWKDKTSGDKVEETEWHRVVCYDRLAQCGCLSLLGLQGPPSCRHLTALGQHTLFSM